MQLWIYCDWKESVFSWKIKTKQGKLWKIISSRNKSASKWGCPQRTNCQHYYYTESKNLSREINSAENKGVKTTYLSKQAKTVIKKLFYCGNYQINFTDFSFHIPHTFFTNNSFIFYQMCEKQQIFGANNKSQMMANLKAYCAH